MSSLINESFCCCYRIMIEATDKCSKATSYQEERFSWTTFIVLCA